jgi:hypothetical protein
MFKRKNDFISKIKSNKVFKLNGMTHTKISI